MKILNWGSLNIDHVYQVEHFVQPGETLSSQSYACFSGGKGANQSIALAHAGATVYHAGKIGRDGLWLKQKLDACSVNTEFTEVGDTPTGHAIIQVTPAGENAIIIHGGANQKIDSIESVLAQFGAGDYLLLQNEINAIADIMRAASKRGMRIVFNPAPMETAVLDYPLALVDWFIVNEIEAKQLSGQTEPEAILVAMRERFPKASVVLTLGKQGAICRSGEQTIRVPAETVTAVDTTAAGDTFIGYFLSAMSEGESIEESLRLGCQAAAICVQRPGAADSIPKREELTIALWRVLRLDDNGNTFVIAESLTETAAQQIVEDYQAKGHKQTYWAEPLS